MKLVHQLNVSNSEVMHTYNSILYSYTAVVERMYLGMLQYNVSTYGTMMRNSYATM